MIIILTLSQVINFIILAFKKKNMNALNFTCIFLRNQVN